MPFHTDSVSGAWRLIFANADLSRSFCLQNITYLEAFALQVQKLQQSWDDAESRVQQLPEFPIKKCCEFPANCSFPPKNLRSSQLRTSEDTVAQLHLGEGPGS